MCGRFSFAPEWADLTSEFSVVTTDFTAQPRYNVAPLQMITAIISDGRSRRIGPLRWGLIPHWAKDASIGAKLINARAETLEEKPAFRPLLTRRRCLIPADGYFEWKKGLNRSHKEPYRIMLRERKLFAMAGLYDIWVAPDGQKISSCTIITTAPNELTGIIHNRMPAILTKEGEELWLSNTEFASVKSVLTPYPAEAMRMYPVSPSVGNVKNDSPDCLREYSPGQIGFNYD